IVSVPKTGLTDRIFNSFLSPIVKIYLKLWCPSSKIGFKDSRVLIPRPSLEFLPLASLNLGFIIPGGLVDMRV
ncbi:MAG: hypothetical protein C0407_16790, partial [Desulfobacca sp.]|nr:hypothetical protein [Desulfobacca sp.]